MTTAAAPKNKRLSDRDRTVILAFAQEQIAATEDRGALDAAYNRAAEAILAKVEAEFPPKDMKVLARYKAAEPDGCIFVSTGGNNYDRFEFRAADKRIPLRPLLRGCNRQPVLLTGEDEEAYDDYAAKAKASKVARRVRYNDFKALVYGTPGFNALAEVWPAVEELRERIVGTGTALAVLSSEVIDRLRADPAFAKAA